MINNYFCDICGSNHLLFGTIDKGHFLWACKDCKYVKMYSKDKTIEHKESCKICTCEATGI
jgi:hypothetical protein